VIEEERVSGSAAEKTVRDIKRVTLRHFSAEDKIRIVIAGLRGEDRIAELCRKESISQNLYYRWSKEFLEAGKKRLAGDTVREATSAHAGFDCPEGVLIFPRSLGRTGTSGTTMAVSWYVVAALSVTLAAILAAKETARQPLED
jgi:transposase